MKFRSVFILLLIPALLLSACGYQPPQNTGSSSDPALQESQNAQPTNGQTGGEDTEDPSEEGPATYTSIEYDIGDVTVDGETYTVGPYTFRKCTYTSNGVETTGLALTRCESGVENAVIPEEVGGIPVIAIADQALAYRDELKKVVLPSTILSIGELAFSDCPNLTDINFPESVEYVGFQAFGFTPGPKEVRVTSALNCEYYAFEYVQGVETVIVEDGVDSIPFELPGSVSTLQLSHTMTELRSELLVNTQVKFLEVYEGVTKLGFNVFGNEVLESVILPSTLTVIEDDIFWGDNYDGVASSEYVQAPVKQIFFRGTEEQCLQELKNQAAVIEVPIYYYSETQPTEEGNFWHYVDGEPVIYGDEPPAEPEAEEFRVVSIGTRTYRWNAGDYREITIVINGKTVSGLTLYSCYKSIEELIIPEEVYGIPVIAIGTNTSNQNDVFPNPINQDIKRVVIPDTVLYIGKYTFSYCTYLSDLTIPSSVKWIDSYAFYSSPGIKELRITADMKVTECSFYAMEALERVIFDEGVTYIPSFYGCEALTELKLPSTATILGMPYMNFIGETSIKFLEIPEGVLYLGFYLLSVSSVESVIVPSTLLEVKNDAFITDTLQYVYFRGTEEQCPQDLTVEVAKSDATLYFYSETEPTKEGNFWHYVDGKPVIW